MLIIISSAKTLNFEQFAFKKDVTPNIFPKITDYLLSILKNYSETQLSKLMDISKKLAKINQERFKNFEEQESKAAIFAYAGDVFNNIKIDEIDDKSLNFLQSHLLIISGLYGALRPLDAIKPYRLEMVTKLNEVKNLIDFWKKEITTYVDKALDNHENKYLLNLASQEYSSVIDSTNLKYPMVNIHFKENKNGELVTIGINAKKARGNMVNIIAKNFIDSPMQLKDFTYLSYKFSERDSSDNNIVFIK